MSRTTPLLYYDLFVVPNFEDYIARANDIRLAFNACVPAAQQADIMFAYYRREDRSKISRWGSLKALHIDLCKREPSFVTILSIAAAYKHLHARGTHYDISTGGSLDYFRSPKTGDLTSSWEREGETTWRPDIIVNKLDGSKASLTQALTAVVRNLWPSVLPPET
ncbi:hypothetical protein [Bradyrhizobium sp. C9]|uniref:hypothetical protein n=1 Tax=Bradyrhizobium sp. C9 TaxID=142585 RepID=UPI000BE7A4A8|nr:hypothetical protein [Bradyrhizobium sp. C9]PDT75095.1 hypothetical protein CO675_22725 [Bradyrhizobium sp. C9]